MFGNVMRLGKLCFKIYPPYDRKREAENENLMRIMKLSMMNWEFLKNKQKPERDAWVQEKTTEVNTIVKAMNKRRGQEEELLLSIIENCEEVLEVESDDDSDEEEEFLTLEEGNEDGANEGMQEEAPMNLIHIMRSSSLQREIILMMQSAPMRLASEQN